jgi:hypothetical protein
MSVIGVTIPDGVPISVDPSTWGTFRHVLDPNDPPIMASGYVMGWKRPQTQWFIGQNIDVREAEICTRKALPTDTVPR